MVYTTGEELRRKLKLSDEQVEYIDDTSERFPMLIPEYYLSLIDPNDPDDPIRKMSVPGRTELIAGGSFDTSGEGGNTVMTGLQHKYRETAMLLSTNKCAMYCRHCFRKRLVGASDDEVAKNAGAIAAYVAEHDEITNVLITGGDSFMNSNETIKRWLDALIPIEHIHFIRFGTRTPVVLPERITRDTELLSIIEDACRKKQIYIITQFNHPREVTPQARAAVRLLRRAGAVIRNQTVLLRGVNDTAETLSLLLRRLTAMGVLPYYIFQCRPVTGVASAFQVPLREGVEIVEAAKGMTSGQGKAVKYCMSHPEGKLEIIGVSDSERMIFKYHEAREAQNAGKLLFLPVGESDCWLGNLQ